MKNIVDLVKLIKNFYHNQQGVYVIMTALMSFGLIGLVTLSVDGSGLLLDKARLAQGTEQAALALVSEANAFRENKEHADVLRQTVSKEEVEGFGEGLEAELKAKQNKRNQEIIQGIVKNYLRTQHDNQDNSVDSKAAVTVENDFYYECKEEIINSSNNNALRKPITCAVQAEVERKSWLYWSGLHKADLSYDKRETIKSELTFVTKEKGFPIPIDLIVINDLSDSMYYPPQGGTKRKIASLRDVMKKVVDMLIPDESESASPYNRIGAVSFALGAQQQGDKNNCVLPYFGDNYNYTMQITYNDSVSMSGGRDWTYADPKHENFNARYDYLKGLGFTIKDEQGADYIRGKTKINNDPKIPYSHVAYSEMFVTAPIVEIMKALLVEVPKANFRLNVDSHYSRIGKHFAKYHKHDYTLNSIDNFNGKNIDYDITYEKTPFCLGRSKGRSMTDSWYSKGQIAEAHNFINGIEQHGYTLASSGLLLGANMMMNKSTVAEAQPDKLGVNTQRILLVMSDGNDTVLPRLTRELLNMGMCDRIRNKLDSLQDENVAKVATKVAFVSFDFKQRPEDEQAWKACTGESNYYEATNEEELLEAFKSIVSVDQEVGKLDSSKKFF